MKKNKEKINNYKGKKSKTINKKASKRSYRRSNRRGSNRRRSNRRRNRASINSLKNSNQSKRYKQYNKKRVYKRNFIIKGGNPTLQDIKKIQEHINMLLFLIKREKSTLDLGSLRVIEDMRAAAEDHSDLSDITQIDPVLNTLKALQKKGQAILSGVNFSDVPDVSDVSRAQKARLKQLLPEPDPETELQGEQKLTLAQPDIIKTKIRTKMDAKKQKGKIKQLLHDWWKCLLYYRFLLMDDDDDEIPPPFLEYLYDLDDLDDLDESWRGWSPEEKLQFSEIMKEAFYEYLSKIDYLTMPELELFEKYGKLDPDELQILINARYYYQLIFDFRSSPL